MSRLTSRAWVLSPADPRIADSVLPDLKGAGPKSSRPWECRLCLARVLSLADLGSADTVSLESRPANPGSADTVSPDSSDPEGNQPRLARERGLLSSINAALLCIDQTHEQLLHMRIRSTFHSASGAPESSVQCTKKAEEYSQKFTESYLASLAGGRGTIHYFLLFLHHRKFILL